MTTNVFINEFHYDNDSTDFGEFIEIAGLGGTNLTGWSIELYNGNNGTSYDTRSLDGTIIPDLANGFGTIVENYPTNGIQNGSPDGIALVNNGTVVQFLSYEGSFTATSGSANGLTSTDIGVAESGSTPVGFSLQLTGTGTMLEDFTWSVPGDDTPGAINNGQSFREEVETPTFELIHDIQGSGTTSPIIGQTVTVEAIVVGDFQGEDGLQGFFLQEEDADIDSNLGTSEGIFVFDGNLSTVDVAVGDKVQVTGTVDESFELTQLTNISSITVIDSDNILPTAATVNFPLTLVEDLETFEGMRVTIPDTLFVTEYFNLDRFGEIRLAADGGSNAPGTDGRLDQFTQFNAPDTQGFAAYQEEIAKRQIILDDGSTNQNPDPLIFGRGGQPLSSNNTLRGGDTVEGLSGVLSFGFGNYRIQTNEGVDFQPTNPRPAIPEDIGGSLKVASFNVLNFFTTLDVEGNPGSGPNNLSPRGADNQAEFDRQLEKLVTTLATLDADIVGLIELENNFGEGENSAIATLVDALNAQVGAGTYTYVDPGVPFVDTSDAISVGVIYKTASVQIAPDTTVEILTDSKLPDLGLDNSVPVFDGPSTNRAPLAVTFEEVNTGEKFTVAVNHFKSKGGTGTGDNADMGDGQGNFNSTRVRGAEAVNTWLNTDPTSSGDSDFLIIGDLNAYAQEDPINTLKTAGYKDLAEEFVGENSYSFVFDGQVGTLDYALANESLTSQVTGATEWHINADEPDALDYNLDFGRDPNLFDGNTPFRASDHDPLLIGLNLSSSLSVNEITGTNSKDNLVGTTGKDVISGLNRRDNLAGLDGDDTLDGGKGSDTLDGGNGDDLLIGGRGLDQLTGGEGKDTFVFGSLEERIDKVTDFEIGQDSIDIRQIFANAVYSSSTPFEDYVNLIQINNNTYVRIDPNGDRSNSFHRTVVILDGVASTDLSADNFLV